MKMIKMALLGGAALAVTSAAAKADNLTALKAQIESLNARVATMEAAPAVPAGYSMMTLGDSKTIVAPGAGQKDDQYILGTANTISVLPTADAPAAADVQWTGYVRAVVAYHKVDDGSDADMDVNTRGQINVVGKTDTAVGEVGVEMRLRAEGDLLGRNPGVVSPKYWGWWAMTPELSLAGGFNGSLGNVGYGYDGACSCNGTDNADAALNPGDAHQLALLYASGPFSAGVALEDASDMYTKDIWNKTKKDFDTVNKWDKAFGGGGNSLGVAGNVKYSGDTLNGGLFGVWHDGDLAEDSYQVGAGIAASFDPVSLSLAAAMGQINNGQDFWGVSALASIALSDEFHAELGASYKDYGKRSTPAGVSSNDDELGVLAGLYYTPVDQLTLGIEAEYVDHQASNAQVRNAKRNVVSVPDAADEIFVDFVSVWSF